jgi:hypothetical protein
MGTPLYRRLATLIEARNNCEDRNPEWHARHTDTILALVREHMPSGSGFDAGTEIKLEGCMPDRLCFATSFHHMNEHGSYTHWTEHKVIVTPSLAHGYNLRITGRNVNGIVDYIGEAFGTALSTDVADY